METSTISKLKELFLNSNHKQILEICESLIEKAPNDIELLYCATSAAFLLNNTQKSYYYLDRLLNLISQIMRQNNVSNEMLLLLGAISIQIPVLVEKIASSEDSKKGKIFQESLECGRFISHKTKNKTLKQMVDSFSKQIINTSKETTYILPKSPLELQIENTNICNLKCTMCPREHMSRKRGYMDIALWEKIIEGWEGKNNTITLTHLVFSLQYTIRYLNGSIKMYFMGEPLLHPEFDTFIKEAKKMGARIGIQTNGVLLKNPAIRERLIRSEPDEIGISLDGLDEASYNNLRKGSDWESMIGNIKGLFDLRKELGVEKTVMLHISTILVEKTPDNINKALSFLKPIAPYVDSINGITLTKLHNPVFINEEGQLQEYKKLSKSRIKKNKPLCEEPFSKLNILWDGTVTPCCQDIDGTIKLGDANINTIDEIWNSDKTRSLHFALITHDISDYPFCQTCTM